MLPDVSVIVTCFNYGKYLERCLRSLLNQELHNRLTYEVVIVDDCSSDESERVYHKFETKFDNVVVIRNIKNQGLAKSCNIGIGASNGRYIVRVDADDYVARLFLFMLKTALDKNRKYQAFRCDYVEVNEFEEAVSHMSPEEKEIACAVMYRKEFLLDVGLYNEEFEYREGHELNKRFRDKYKIGYLPIPLYFARKHESNRSKNSEKINEYDKKLKGA